jgi:uncharacterized membrane protein
MSKLGKFIKTTLVGGMLFLLPLMVLILVVGKAIELLSSVLGPLAEKVHFGAVLGVSMASLVTILLLLIICFLAGVFMRTDIAKKIKRQLEDHVLVYIPGYSYLRAISSDKFESGANSNWRPASVIIDDNEVICFVVDETEHYCSVFLPAAPSPSSGTVVARKKVDVKFLPINVSEAFKLIRRFGKGAALLFEEPLEKKEEKTLK